MIRKNVEIFPQRNTIAAGDHCTLGLQSNGTAIIVGYIHPFGGYYKHTRRITVSGWTNLISVSAGERHIVGLKSDGTAVATGPAINQCNVSGWTNLISVSAGCYHTVGLKSDGTVVKTGGSFGDTSNVSEWSDVVSVSAGYAHIVGIKSDGTAVATGNSLNNQCDVGNWTNLVAISAGHSHTVGLKSDGTAVATKKPYRNGIRDSGASNVHNWTNLVAISAGHDHTVGLKSDGTAVATGSNGNGRCNVSGWSDLVSVSAGLFHTVGLKADGTVVAVGGTDLTGECNISSWSDLMLPLNDILSVKRIPVSSKQAKTLVENEDPLLKLEPKLTEVEQKKKDLDEPFIKLATSYPESIHDRRQLYNLLKDFYPNQPLQINLLINLHDLEILKDLAGEKTNIYNRFSKKLADNYGISAEHAKWAIDTWVEAYKFLK